MSKCPSLSQLTAEKNKRWILDQESRIRAEARTMGVRNPDGKDVWALLGRVQDARDEKKRPELEGRAEKLGIRTNGFFGFGKRDYLSLWWEVHNEEERQRLCRQMGYS